VLIGWQSERYYYNFFLGPFPKSQGKLEAIENPGEESEYFVVVSGDTLFNTGYTQVEKQMDKYTDRVRSEKTVGYYMVLLVHNRLLIVMADRPEYVTRFEGRLTALPVDVRNGVIGPTSENIKAAFVPFMLDATGFRGDGIAGLVVIIPLILAAVWGLILVARRSSNASVHPIYKRLAPFGDPMTVAGSIDTELRNQPADALPKCRLTLGWLIVPRLFRTDFIRLQDLLWMYLKRVKHSVNFIPAGSSYSAVLLTRSGRKFEIGSTEKGVNSILSGVHQRTPWIVTGYTKDLDRLFRNDLQRFIEQVEQRKAP